MFRKAPCFVVLITVLAMRFETSALSWEKSSSKAKSLESNKMAIDTTLWSLIIARQAIYCRVHPRHEPDISITLTLDASLTSG